MTKSNLQSPNPDWWGYYECAACGGRTRASSLPPYCPHCEGAGRMTVIESARRPGV